MRKTIAPAYEFVSLRWIFGWQKAGTDLDVFQRIQGLDTHVNGVNGRDDLVGAAPGIEAGFVSFHNESGETGESSEKLKPVPIKAPSSVRCVLTRIFLPSSWAPSPREAVKNS